MILVSLRLLGPKKGVQEELLWYFFSFWDKIVWQTEDLVFFQNWYLWRWKNFKPCLQSRILVIFDEHPCCPFLWRSPPLWRLLCTCLFQLNHTTIPRGRVEEVLILSHPWEGCLPFWLVEGHTGGTLAWFTNRKSWGSWLQKFIFPE